jgi:hypothetical protein
MRLGSFSVLTQDSTTSERFRNDFDRTAFSFSHTLHEAECFGRPALLELAERMGARGNRFYVEEEDTAPGERWRLQPPQKPLVQALEEIEGAHSFVMLKRVHEEQPYGEILEECLRELSETTGVDIHRRYYDPLMTILITSPLRVTPYHMDAESALLMQVHASKAMYLFNGNDRAVLPESELERYWTGDINAATYKQELQDRAWRFALKPGVGVFFPVTFPHWVQNGAEVSISVSINFKRVRDNVADAYRVNSRLRKIGLHPMQPGKSPLVDHAKGAIYRAVRTVKHSIHD